MMKRNIPSLLFLSALLSVLLGASHPSIPKEKEVEVLFTSHQPVQQKLIESIRTEKDSIYVAVYQFSDYKIAKALIEAFHRGVRVEVLVDPISVKKRSPLKRMSEEGIPIFVWCPNQGMEQKKEGRSKPLMHHKFCVFGRDVVWMGSYNFSRQASLHHKESVILFHDEKTALKFFSEFQELKRDQSLPFQKFHELFFSPSSTKGPGLKNMIDSPTEREKLAD